MINMSDKILDKAKKAMGTQFNEAAWYELIKKNPKEAESLIAKM